MPRNAARLAPALAALLLGSLPPAGFAAETDNLTYRFLPLEDSAPKVNAMLNATLRRIAEQTNARLEGAPGGPSRVSDTEVELDFVEEYRHAVLGRFGDRLLPILDACVEENDCPGWPRFQRLELRDGESIYGESGYNPIAIASLSPSIELCGVRMGADKLTHLFSNGFFYYNAGRRKGSRPRDAQDAYLLALADERGLMGARSTGVESPADAEASRGGYRLASSYFEGDDPVFARSAETGLLVKRRDADVCTYVSPAWDEAANPPRYAESCRKSARVEAAVAERIAENEWAERALTEEDKLWLAQKILERPAVTIHARFRFPFALVVAARWVWSYLTLPRDSREAVNCIVFPKFSKRKRIPIVLKREPPD
jgi:hypothetical protein